MRKIVKSRGYQIAVSIRFRHNIDRFVIWLQKANMLSKSWEINPESAVWNAKKWGELTKTNCKGLCRGWIGSESCRWHVDIASLSVDWSWTLSQPSQRGKLGEGANKPHKPRLSSLDARGNRIRVLTCTCYRMKNGKSVLYYRVK